MTLPLSVHSAVSWLLHGIVKQEVECAEERNWSGHPNVEYRGSRWHISEKVASMHSHAVNNSMLLLRLKFSSILTIDIFKYAIVLCHFTATPSKTLAKTEQNHLATHGPYMLSCKFSRHNGSTTSRPSLI